MNRPMKIMLALLVGMAAGGMCRARTGSAAPADKVVTFRFVPGTDMFYIPWAGNGTELERLYTLIDAYRSEIAAGTLPVYVDGYCASLPTPKENLNTAFIRANRVKSALIVHKGLKEADFITGNYASAYGELKDVVVVTLRIPAKKEPERPQPVREEPKREDPPVTPQPRTEPASQPAQEPVAEAASEPSPSLRASAPEKPYCLALRTNLLYDAFLLPTLGVEWRVSNSVGVKLDGSLSWWGDEHGKVQKIWLINPEVRWYLLRNKRFYAGLSGNYGKYNVYKYMVGGLFSDDTGYEGTLWNAGLAVGYQLYLSRSFSVDFNLGLGYMRSEYDSFRIIDGTRVYKDRNRTKNFWGPTQAGISLMWTIGGKKR